MGLEQNAKRLTVTSYGPRKTITKMGGVNDTNWRRIATWTFNYDDLPAPGTYNLQHVIPAGSSIISAKLRIITAFTSTSTTTDLTIGLQQADGTVIDNSGLVSATDATQTTIGTAGNVITGSGTLVGKTIGAANGELVVAPTVADLLTGRAEVIVEYFLPAPVQQS